MALRRLRGCYGLPSTFIFTRLLLTNRINPNRSNKALLPSSPPARPYSSDRDNQNQNQTQKVVVVLPNPFIWFRIRIYFFLIRAYFDKEFNREEFTEGATQAFSHVSRLLSQCKFEALEGLVAEDLIGKLEEKCNQLSSTHKKALSAESDEIMYTAPGDVGIHYDDNGRKFVSILMRFWYLTSARLPDDTLEDFISQMGFGGKGKRLLTANYEFQREFTKGAPPDWTITRVEHSKLLDKVFLI
ncbi:m-AAA protease-interacting protein 1, mitochondrial [Dicentrarchus labrax]|uniref:m-AAA protease-interacting protein 1, mitochondrial n=1 Tax=Dicentrarchus labrax TaxID=13489 RepID=UPI0021F5ABE2|nr:m-AAA protease-interacting protein 1, mitochondrial [Dicentrarchus labrax]